VAAVEGIRLNGVLLRNFAALSVLQGANYLVPLITVPYLVSVLGVDRFGMVAFGQAFAQYFVVLTDYGFNYSATRMVSVSRDDPAKIASLYWSVSLIKAGLMVLGFLLMVGLVLIVPSFHGQWPLFALSYLAVLGNVLFPVWLFQGLERMTNIAVASIAARVLSLICIFILVRGPQDYLVAAALQAGAAVVAGVFATWLLFKTVRVTPWRPELSVKRDLRMALTDGWHVFLSTAAVSLYTNSNIFALGLLTTATAAGYYAMADKLIRAALGAMQPFVQALYPRMSYLFSKDISGALQRLKAAALPASMVGVLLGVGLLAAGRLIVRLIFGAQASPAAQLLQILSFVPLLVLLSNLLGVQLLFPLGRQAPVARFQLVAGVASVVALVPMVLFWGAVGSAINYLLLEVVITLGFLYIAMKTLKEVKHASAGGGRGAI
jgi:PST family polysaccharide transporter